MTDKDCADGVEKVIGPRDRAAERSKRAKLACMVGKLGDLVAGKIGDLRSNGAATGVAQNEKCNMKPGKP